MRMRVCAFARRLRLPFSKSSGRASFMRWELDATVCVQVCMYVDIALLLSAGSFLSLRICSCFHEMVHGCAHCRRVREGTMGHDSSLGCCIPSGARAYQHHLSGDLFVHKNIHLYIHLRVGILEVEELTHFVCALLVPLSQYGFPHNTTCERHASPWKFLPYGSFSQSTVFQRWYTRGRRGQLHRHRVEETVPLHRCCQG